jgi:hypothetical protein
MEWDTTVWYHGMEMDVVNSALGEAIGTLYNYSLSLVGLCVGVMFLLAGLAYMIPTLQERFGKPTDIIKNAIIGLILLFSAYVILNAINPDLVGSGTGTILQ